MNEEELEFKYKILITNYLSGEASEKEKLAFSEWLRESDKNRRLFSEYRKVYELSFIGNDKNKFSGRNQENWERLTYKIDSFSREPGHPKTRKLLYYSKIAAAVLFIFFAGAASFHWLSGTNSNQNLSHIKYEISAPRGGKSELVLSDGTKVWLNAGTRLHYGADYGINSRVVYLEGEGYFSVVKNPEKPFIVQTSGLKIKAYGTSFNVKAYADEKIVTTTLVEGIVKIEGKGVNLSLKPKEVVILNKEVSKYATGVNHVSKGKPGNVNAHKPGDKAKESTTNNIVKIASNVNTNIYTSWKDNLWIIESEPLKNIAVILERKFNVSIVIKSPELDQYTFTGTFNNETLEQILDIIKLTAPLNYQISKGIVVITEEQKRKATYNNFMK